MAVTTRIVKNTGTPFKDAAGNALGGVAVSFRLVNAQGRPAEMFTTSGEWIGAQAVTAESDINGEISVSIPTTDQATSPVYWLCAIDYTVNGIKAYRDFIAPLNDGVGDVTLSQFRAGTT